MSRRARFLTIILSMLLSFVGARAVRANLENPLKHAVTISDVLSQEHIDRATLSPDGQWIAVVVRRGANAGEVYGRGSYEVDPTRSDVWLISIRTGEKYALTHGAHDAAGFWCATWSPDGKRLAMLSTKPEGSEPRGGNNVRLYIWDRDTQQVLRASGEAIMTQTRYGSPLDVLDLRGGANHGTSAHTCSTGLVAENAPFVWLDDHRLLIVSLPHGEISAAINQNVRSYSALAGDAVRIHQGIIPTGISVTSGAARDERPPNTPKAILRIINLRTGEDNAIATVPAYPFRGGLTVSVSPDENQAAILATTGALQPQADKQFPNQTADGWTVEHQMGFVALAPGSPLRWVEMPPASRFPLELYGWSPKGKRVSLRARKSAFDDKTPLFSVDADSGAVKSFGALSVGESSATAADPHPAAVDWIDDKRLAMRAKDGRWWIGRIGSRATAVSLPEGAPSPASLVRTKKGSLVNFIGGSLIKLDPSKGAFVAIANLGQNATLLLPKDLGKAVQSRLIGMRQNDGNRAVAVLDTDTGSIQRTIPAFSGDLLEFDHAHNLVLYSEESPNGTALKLANLEDRSQRTLLELNGYLRNVDWGTTEIIHYNTASKIKLNASVILPPDYVSGRRYPTLVWVYGGYQVPDDANGDFMSRITMPGIYNLRLYAAKGYVVLVPSMPLDRAEKDYDVYNHMLDGVIPAVDRLVAMGIADPDRIGVFGQSFGGYSVYALVGQTNRFKAAVAIAGISDLSANYGEFDPTAWSYGSIAHEKSENWALTHIFGLTERPWDAPASYSRNSPLSYVDKVHTPLLMIHGDRDIRGADTQAELFFYSLYAQGKTAELVRYGGESHSLAESPANVRDVFSRIIAWFDQYLKQPAAAH